MEKKEYYYPIIIKNKIPSPFFLSPDVKIKKLTKKNKADFWGIENVDFTWGANCSLEIGHVIIDEIKSANRKGRCNYQGIMQRGIFDGANEILASNYALIVEIDRDHLDCLIERINMTFKLLRPTSTGGYLGFVTGDTATHFHHQYPIPIKGPFDYLDLTKKDLAELKEIYRLLVKNKDNTKLTGALLHFSRALENIPCNKDSQMDVRFLLLMIVLDVLYIPEKGSSAKKMASRISNILLSFS